MHLICTRENPAELQPVLGRFGSGVSRRRARAPRSPDAARRRRSVYTSHITFQPDAPHTLHARPTPLHEQKSAHTSALHLHDRRTCAGLLCRLLRPPHAQLRPADGKHSTDSHRLAPDLAAARGPTAAAAAATAATEQPPLPPSCSALRLL